MRKEFKAWPMIKASTLGQLWRRCPLQVEGLQPYTSTVVLCGRPRAWFPTVRIWDFGLQNVTKARHPVCGGDIGEKRENF